MNYQDKPKKIEKRRIVASPSSPTQDESGCISHPTIMDVVNLANEIRSHRYLDENLPISTPVLTGLASGLDTGLTILEASTGSFQGLSPDAAKGIVAYFTREAERSSKTNQEIAIWYECYASAIEQLFIQDREGV